MRLEECSVKAMRSRATTPTYASGPREAGTRWVEYRLLELGVTLARGLEATRDLACELLDANPEHIQAMLALASIASRKVPGARQNSTSVPLPI